jgi:hypothetical protein
MLHDEAQKFTLRTTKSNRILLGSDLACGVVAKAVFPNVYRHLLAKKYPSIGGFKAWSKDFAVSLGKDLLLQQHAVCLIVVTEVRVIVKAAAK